MVQQWIQSAISKAPSQMPFLWGNWEKSWWKMCVCECMGGGPGEGSVWLGLAPTRPCKHPGLVLPSLPQTCKPLGTHSNTTRAFVVAARFCRLPLEQRPPRQFCSNELPEHTIVLDRIKPRQDRRGDRKRESERKETRTVINGWWPEIWENQNMVLHGIHAERGMMHSWVSNSLSLPPGKQCCHL